MRKYSLKGKVTEVEQLRHKDKICTNALEIWKNTQQHTGDHAEPPTDWISDKIAKIDK